MRKIIFLLLTLLSIESYGQKAITLFGATDTFRISLSKGPMRLPYYVGDSTKAFFTDASGNLFLKTMVSYPGVSTLQEVTEAGNATTEAITTSLHTITPTNDTFVANSVENGGIVLEVNDPTAADFVIKHWNRLNFSAAGNDNRMSIGYNVGDGTSRVDITLPQARLEFEQKFTIGTPYSDAMQEFHYNVLNAAGSSARPFAIYTSINNLLGSDNASLIEIVTTNGKIAADVSGSYDFITWTKSGGLTLNAETIGSASGTAVFVTAGDGSLAKSTQIAQSLVANLTTDLAALVTVDATKWGRSGNSITANDFIGTTNNADLIAKTANVIRFRIDSSCHCLVINEAVANPSANLSTKTNSASLNKVWDMYNSAGTLFGGILEASTGGTGGLSIYGNRGAGGTGAGILLEGHAVTNGTTGIEYRALGGTKASPVVFPSAIAHDFTFYDGTLVPHILTLEKAGSLTVYNPTNANFMNISVAVGGVTTLNATGSGTPAFTFSDPLTATNLTSGTAKWSSGSADPNGNVVGSPGDMYSRSTGGALTSFYVKESGSATNTGWVGK